MSFQNGCRFEKALTPDAAGSRRVIIPFDLVGMAEMAT
jgi:hypothetical protein